MRARQIARRVRAVLNGKAPHDRSWHQPLMELADRARHAADRDTRIRRYQELQTALAPLNELGLLSKDVLEAMNPRHSDKERIDAAERALKELKTFRRKNQAVNLFAAISDAHQVTGDDPPPAMRLGIATDKFATWLRRRVNERGTQFYRDEHPKAADPERASTPKKDEAHARRRGSSSVEDAGLLMGLASPQERRLAELLARGLSPEQAAQTMRISEENVRQLLFRLRGRF